MRQAADGFRIAVTGLPPHATAPPLTVGGSGAYLLVVSGAIDDSGGPYGTGSVTWRAAGDSVRESRRAKRVLGWRSCSSRSPGRRDPPLSYAVPGSLA